MPAVFKSIIRRWQNTIRNFSSVWITWQASVEIAISRQPGKNVSKNFPLKSKRGGLLSLNFSETLPVMFSFDSKTLRFTITSEENRKEELMTNLQKLELRRSEIREKLSKLSAVESLEPEQKTEITTLTEEFQDSEVRYRAALIAEGEKAQTKEFGTDGEGAEIRALRTRAPLKDYVLAASEKRSLGGPHAELNEALGVRTVGSSGGIVIPFSVLAGERRQLPKDGEERAFTTTGEYSGGELQRPILQELFGPGIFDALGVRVDSVPAGASEWPLLSGNVVPAQRKEGTAAADATAASFLTASLKAKRLTAEIELTHEMIAAVVGVEESFRMNLLDALKSKMQDIILNGTVPTVSNPQNIEGFFTKLTGADLASAEATAGDYGGLHALAVDGVHASTENEVTSVIGDETYRHAAQTYLSGTAVSGSQLLRERSAGCMASTYIPDAASMKQKAILHASGPNGGEMRGDSVAGMWEGAGLEVIRDFYSNASVGVTLTGIIMWDAAVALRASAYKEIDIQIAS